MKEENRSNEVVLAMRQLRRAQGLNQQELADRLGVSKQTVSNVESGSTPMSVSMERKFKEFEYQSHMETATLLSKKPLDNSNLTLNIAGLKQFEDMIVRMREEDVRAGFKRLREFDAKMTHEADCLYVDIKLALSYFEKRVALLDGFYSAELFIEINASARDYFRLCPEVNSDDLINILVQAGIKF